jgi:hypothetical protein
MDLIRTILASAGGGMTAIVVIITVLRCIQKQRSISKEGESNEIGW